MTKTSNAPTTQPTANQQHPLQDNQQLWMGTTYLNDTNKNDATVQSWPAE